MSRLFSNVDAFEERKLMKKTLITVTMAAALVAMTGCATLRAPGIAPGTSQADVERSLGKPTDVRTVSGATVWDYAIGPFGFQTWRVSFDGANRVQRVDQILVPRAFASLESGTSREEVAARLGRPTQINQFPRMDDEVWTYRYKDITLEMLAEVHLSMKTGRVQYVATYRDPAFVSTID